MIVFVHACYLLVHCVNDLRVVSAESSRRLVIFLFFTFLVVFCLSSLCWYPSFVLYFLLYLPWFCFLGSIIAVCAIYLSVCIISTFISADVNPYTFPSFFTSEILEFFLDNCSFYIFMVKNNKWVAFLSARDKEWWVGCFPSDINNKWVQCIIFSSILPGEPLQYYTFKSTICINRVHILLHVCTIQLTL